MRSPFGKKVMIGEAGYIEIMKNCSNWNSRIETERKGRYPVLDAQTGIAQRPSQYAPITFANRYPASSPSQVCTYMSQRWRKRSAAPSSDATEMKYIVQCNPAINDVLNQTATSTQSEFSATTGENSLSQSDVLQIEKRLNKIAYETTFENEVEDASEEDAVDVSDEEDWSEGKKKRKKRGGASSGSSRGNARKSAGGSTTSNAQLTPLPSTLPPDPKPFVCHQCGAKYKSRPGLNYHRAHVHPETSSPCSTPQPPHCTN